MGVAGLPPPSMERVVFGAMLRELEARMPGFIRNMREEVESSATRSRVVRLRGPRFEADTIEALDIAASWLAHAEDVVYSGLGRPEVREKRKKHG
jgi:hypothetical protein